MSDRLAVIAEEIREVVDLAELKGLWAFGQREENEYASAECVGLFKDAVKSLRTREATEPTKETVVINEAMSVEEQLAAVMAELQALKSGKKTVAAAQVARKRSNKYRILNLEVGWSTTPQVHAVAAILAAHFKVGDVATEEDIVAAMVANERVLNTKQGGKRIWDYYKGKTDKGLELHGNIERV